MGEQKILDALNSRYCCLKEPSVDLPGYKYMTYLRVYGTREDDDEPQSPHTLGQHIIDPQILKKKITAAISATCFRDPHVLVQFWLPSTVRKRCFLTTFDQPFGIGVANEALYKYRLEYEKRIFFVDREHIEELGPSGRVYHQKLPEWSLDVQGLPTSHNNNGYICFPVIDPASGCCVGVLELITFIGYDDYAFEVNHISEALKKQDLKTSNAFEYRSFCELPSEDRLIQLYKIYDILKVLCTTHNLPLAQTWELSPLSSYVSHEKSIRKSCSSFNRKCIGEGCMYAAGLPFYYQDRRLGPFQEACKRQHLEKSRGVVGRALLSHRLNYCEDVTELSEEEYPLIHNARMSGLAGCFAIFLRDVEGKNVYILEFFMPLDIKDRIIIYLLNLVEKLKLMIEYASGFEMGDISSLEEIRPPSVVYNISSMTVVDTPNEIIPYPFVTNVATIACGAYANVSMQKTRNKGNDAGESSNRRSIKPKIDSLTMEAVEKQFGQPMDEAIKSLKVSRSTLKRFLRVHNIPRWPMPKLSTVRRRGRFLSKPTIHVYHVAKLIVHLRRWKKRSFVRIAMAHQEDSLVFENTTNTEQATDNVGPLMDVDLDTIKDLNSVDAIPMLRVDNFIDDQGSSWMEPYGIENSTAAIRIDNAPLMDVDVTNYQVDSPMLNSGSVDGIENPMVETGMGMEGAWSPPIGSGDMSLFGANPSDYDFSNLIFDD